MEEILKKESCFEEVVNYANNNCEMAKLYLAAMSRLSKYENKDPSKEKGMGELHKENQEIVREMF